MWHGECREKKAAKAGIPAHTTAGLCSTYPLNRHKTPDWNLLNKSHHVNRVRTIRTWPERRGGHSHPVFSKWCHETAPPPQTLFVVLCFHVDALTNICYDLHAVVCMARCINRLPLFCRTSDVSHASQSGPSLPGWITEVKTAATGEGGASAGHGCPPALQTGRMTKGDLCRHGIHQSLTWWMGSRLPLQLCCLWIRSR